jgi:hypothetical protein
MVPKKSAAYFAGTKLSASSAGECKLSAYFAGFCVNPSRFDRVRSELLNQVTLSASFTETPNVRLFSGHWAGCSFLVRLFRGRPMRPPHLRGFVRLFSGFLSSNRRDQWIVRLFSGVTHSFTKWPVVRTFTSSNICRLDFLYLALFAGIVRLFSGLDPIRGFTALSGFKRVSGKNHPFRGRIRLI